MRNGQTVELTVNRGDQKRHIPMGALIMDRLEWEHFRVLIVGGMRAASLARIPISLMDQTRKREAVQ